MFDIKKKRLFIATIMAMLFATIQPLLQANPQTATAQTDAPSLGQIVVASDADPILLFLTELSVLVLEDAGYDVVYRRDIGDSNYQLDYLPNAEPPEPSADGETGAHTSLHDQVIDFHWAHPQKSLAEHLGIDSSLIPNNANKAWRLALATDNKYTELSWLEATTFYDAYSLLVRPGSIEGDPTTIGELADTLNQDNNSLRLCVDAEFYGDENGLQALQEHYRFAFLDENVEIVDPSSLYQALTDDLCDVSLGKVIDWQVAALGLQSLADPEDFFPMYSPAPMVLDEFISQKPEVGELLSLITSELDAQTMSRLNVQMVAGADGLPGTGDEESIEEVARSFLVEKQLLPKPEIVVGSKNSTEQFILGEMLALLLENAGYRVINQIGYGDDAAVRLAMLNNEIDVLFDLTGIALTTYHNLPLPALPSSPERAFELARGLDAENGIEWLGMGEFNNTRTLMVHNDYAENGINTIDDLAAAINSGTATPRICIESTFYSQNQGGFDALQETYGFQFDEQLVELMDIDSVYDGLQVGDCDIALGNTTDGRGSAWGFTNLEDTRAFFLQSNPSPVARRAILDANPELRELLQLVTPHLDDETMSSLNAQVDIGTDGIFNSGDEESPKKVAERFLRQQKLLKLPPIVVASQDYTEQYVLGHILLLLLEDAGYDVIDKNRLGSLEVVRESILNDEVDVVFELTGDALSIHHGLPAAAVPSGPERSFELARSLDAQNDLVWLGLGPFNNTWTLMVRDDLLEKDIASIDALATYVNTGVDLPRICIESVFFSRPQDGFDAMQALYEFQFPDEFIELMDVDSAYEGLRSGECDIAQGYATDGRGGAWGFTNLEDTRSFFPYYSPAPVVRREVLEAIPELEALLTGILPYLDNETMRSLNARVDIGEDGLFATGDEETPRQVARAFLNQVAGDTEAAEPAEEGAVSEPNTADNTTGNGSPDSEIPIDDSTTDTPTVDTPTANGPATDTEEQNAEEENTAEESEKEASTESVENSESVVEEDDQGASLPSGSEEPDKTSSEALRSFVDSWTADNGQPPQIATSLVGSVEQQLMGEIINLMLEDVGYEVNVNNTQSIDEDVRAALENGSIDLYAEITSNALASVYGLPESTLPTVPERSLRLIQRLDEANAVVWLAASEVDSAPTLVIQAELGNSGIASIEDLALLTREADERPNLCVEESALEATPFGLERLQEAYRMVFLPENILVTERDELYAALLDGRCDVVQGFSTDGQIAMWDLIPLEDTLDFFPAAIHAPAVRQELLDKNPGMASYIEELRPHLTSSQIRSLAAQVMLGEDGETDTGDETLSRNAARDFLCDVGLIIKCSSEEISNVSVQTDDEADITSPSAAALSTEVDSAETDISDSPAPADGASHEASENEAATDAAATGVEPETTANTFVPLLANPLSPTLNASEASIEITIPRDYGVNARFTSNTDSTVVEVLARGSIVTAVGRVADNSWLQIELPDGRLVWVFTEAVFYSTGSIDALPIVSPPLDASP